MKDRYVIILAGGSGTRLWPLSRSLLPKQFLSIDGGPSLLQKTVARLLPRVSPENVVIVTHESHRFEVSGQMLSLDPRLAENVLAEPVARNTLPAIAWAVRHIAKKSPNAMIGVFSSDQHVGDEKAFLTAWDAAESNLPAGHIALFGLKPTEPATGYGYIQAGEILSGPLKKVARFVEKPDLKTAEEYLKDGRYFWNGGMFLFRAGDFLTLLKRHQPQIAELAAALPVKKGNLAEKSAYEAFPSLSIDYGLIEKISELAVIPAEIGWSDLGSWEAIYKHLPHDAHGNSTRGQVAALDSSDNLFFSEDKFLAAFGVKGLAVIQTADATLVCPRDKAENLKSLVNLLAKSKPELLEVHVTAHRPWGRYTVLEERSNYKIKHLVVLPGQKLSLQMHSKRSEHWVVLEGVALVQNGDREIALQKNESTFIPMGNKHRIVNTGDVPLEIIEVQMGDYVGEDDIVRFEDSYDRS